MSWVRVSDAFAMHPMLLQVLEFQEADDRILNEFAGFIMRCSTSAAAYETDYVITKGMVQTLAGSFERNRVLCELALKIGVFTAMKDPKGRIVYKLIEEEDLVHMILKAERIWKNRQKQDNRNPKLTAPVRKRDGDECRWCGVIVNWNNDRKSGRAGTYDHLNPGQGAASPDELVVCCKACNSSRRDDAASWDKTLRPAPETPYYSKQTVTFLAKENIVVKPSDSLPIEVKDAEPTVSLVPAEPTDAVDPAEVEPDSVEPERLAPETTGPSGAAPVSAAAPGNEETYDFDFERMDEEMRSAPDWVREVAQEASAAEPTDAVDPAEVEPDSVEPERLAPETTGPSGAAPVSDAAPAKAPWATRDTRENVSGRFRQISTVTDLDLSGRDGIDSGDSYIQKRPAVFSEPCLSAEEKKRKRRRRRRKGNSE